MQLSIPLLFKGKIYMGENKKKREREEIAAAVDAELSQRFHVPSTSHEEEPVFTQKRPRQMNYDASKTDNETFGYLPQYDGPVVNLCEPVEYEDAKKIATSLFNQQVVYVKLTQLNDRVAGRLIDFLTGVVYGIDGDIQRVNSEMFICTPSQVEVTDDLLNRFETDDH